MPDPNHNPLTDFIGKYIDHFASEARRLHDKTPLIEYKKLVDSLILVTQKLGTLEHGVALAALSEEYKRATREAVQAWREIWRDFFAARRDVIDVERSNQEAEVHIREVEESLASTDYRDEELAEAMRSLLMSAKQANAAEAELSKGWNRGPWLLLWASLQNYTVYLRYFVARLFFSVMRHGFIVLVGILIFGMLFSTLMNLARESISGLATALPWPAVLLAFGAYVLKKYYIDPKVQKLQVKLEARWLSSVALNIHFVRTLALLSRTRSRKAPHT
ncbi:hypothetical protein H8A97_03580 [Bradyrhizobium sp. Arg62]|uniref:hypothetical protein n=1 Tax=Bradyrhizobium brasilense TaxID=1419277 RepID=UPI001E304B9E|nr:hypothetical protein [Bradyrhizobium brasilense]MCC8944204.1 hypothetical protein [Bradyrhizobium brasilense]